MLYNRIWIRIGTLFFSAVYKKFVLMAAFFSFVLLLILVPLAPFALSKTFSEAIQYIPFMVVLGFLVTLPSFWGVIYLVVKDTRGVFFVNSYWCGGKFSYVYCFDSCL